MTNQVQEYIQLKIFKIEAQYDPDHDIPGPHSHPAVSATEVALLNICRAQQELIDDLLKQVDAINATLDRIE